MRESWVVQDWLNEGRQEGRREGRLELLRTQLLDKFGPMPDWADARLAAASPLQIEAWSHKILRANTLGEALGQ